MTIMTKRDQSDLVWWPHNYYIRRRSVASHQLHDYSHAVLTELSPLETDVPSVWNHKQ